MLLRRLGNICAAAVRSLQLCVQYCPLMLIINQAQVGWDIKYSVRKSRSIAFPKIRDKREALPYPREIVQNIQEAAK